MTTQRVQSKVTETSQPAFFLFLKNISSPKDIFIDFREERREKEREISM